MRGLDFIGDIHGYAGDLRELLQRLGYRTEDGVYRHPDRQVVFLGDFIDGGKQNLQVIDIAKPMVDAGYAYAVMGNHEYNAICYHTTARDQPDKWLRSHSHAHWKQHERTLLELGGDETLTNEVIGWFRSLPLFLRLDGVRAVHACWDKPAIEYLESRLGTNPVMDDSFLQKSSHLGTAEHEAIETVLKGAEIELPSGVTFADKYGQQRSEARVRWWQRDVDDLAEAVIGPPSLYEATRGMSPECAVSQTYDRDEPPVFFGHYWLTGQPAPQASNVACLDYSVARKGKLVAYRWDGEQELYADRFVW